MEKSISKLKVFKIILGAIQAISSLVALIITLVLNFLPIWIPLIFLVILAAFLVLTFFSIKYNEKVVLSVFAIFFAIIISISCIASFSVLLEISSHFDADAVEEETDIEVDEVDVEDDPVYVYIDMELDNDEYIPDEMSASRRLHTETFAVLNADSGQILLINTFVDEKLDPDEAVDYLEELYDIKMNYYVTIDDSSLGRIFTKLERADDGDSGLETILDNSDKIIDAFVDSFLTNMSLADASDLVLEIIDNIDDVKVSSFVVGAFYGEDYELAIREVEIDQAYDLLDALEDGDTIEDEDLDRQVTINNNESIYYFDDIVNVRY